MIQNSNVVSLSAYTVSFKKEWIVEICYNGEQNCYNFQTQQSVQQLSFTGFPPFPACEFIFGRSKIKEAAKLQW